VGVIERWGQSAIQTWNNLFYGFGFFWLVVRESFRITSHRGVGWKVVVMQILFTGVNALAIILLIALSLGAVIIFEGAQLFSVGQNSLLYTILVTIITRELGPLLTAFIVMARSGVAIATELSNSVISQEIEAYMAVGINPISYLVVPRFIGVTVSVMALTVLFSVGGLAGAWFIVQFIQPLPAAEYFTNLMAHLTVLDLSASLVKALAFGMIIAVVSSYTGFQANQSPTEVPVLAIKAVGRGFSLLIIVNILITLVYLL
jgi:phospholipid/cholesterol/gamma-HCH transport system permease protein